MLNIPDVPAIPTHFRSILALMSGSPFQFHSRQRAMGATLVEPKQEDRTDDCNQVQQYNQAQPNGVTQPFQKFTASRIGQLPFRRGRIALGLALGLLVYPLLVTAVEAEPQKQLQPQKKEQNKVGCRRDRPAPRQ